MRSLTRAKMDTNGGVLGARGRRLLTALVIAAPAALVAGACAETPSIEVPPGDGIDPVLDPDDPRVLRCGGDGIPCGDEGCCTEGNTCTKFGRCVPEKPCTSNEQCTADSQCGGGQCLPWANLPADRAFNLACRTAVDLPSLEPKVQCQWPNKNANGVEIPPGELPTSVQVIGTPMVVDFDFDNDPTTMHPSIVFVSYDTAGNFSQQTGVLRVINGDDCKLQATIQGQFFFTPEVPPALGDVNGDGRPDIVAADEQLFGAAPKSGVAVFEAIGDGTTDFKPMRNGRVDSAGTGIIKGFALHDVDGDDLPEIFTDKTMLHFDKALDSLVDVTAIQPPGGDPGQLTGREPPMVVDLDGDTQAEVITPQGIFSWNIAAEEPTFIDKSRGAGNEPLFDPDDKVNGAFMAMGNLANWNTGLPGGADSAELVVIGHAGEVWVKLVDGTLKISLDAKGGAGGPPVIADFDGDGRMEFATGGNDKLTVFDLDCTPSFYNERFCGNGRGKIAANGVLWQGVTQGATSGVAVFDFDGDTRAEVVYADQCFMRVYDGITGDVLFSTPRSSTTQWEYPVVADVDGDTFSELVTASNDNDDTLGCPATDPLNSKVAFEPSHGITVWKEANDRWMGSRPIWNQHNYFVTNVNDDGTIPSMSEVKSQWDTTRGGQNTFRQNVQGATGASLSLADVTTAGVPAFECLRNQDLATVTVDLCNRGNTPLRRESAEVTLVDPARPTTVLCSQKNSNVIDKGRCEQVTCPVPVTRGAAPFDIQIMGDALGRVNECSENNNSSLISRVSCIRDDLQ